MWSRSLLPALLLAAFAAIFAACGLGVAQVAAPEPLMARPDVPNAQAAEAAATAILHRALHEAVWGIPARSEVRQEIVLNGQRSTGFGDFVRGGQGGGKLRMSLRLAAGNQFHHLIQVSDGELMYSHEEIAEESRRMRVDLGRIRERLVITTDSLNDPTIAMYLAVGGQAELLRKLCQQYRWLAARPGEVAGEPVIWLTGKVAEQPVQTRALAEIDTINRDLFAFLPTYTEVAIGREEASFPFWLYELRQFRPVEASSLMQYSTELSVKIEYPHPNPLTAEQLTPELFEFQLNNEPFIDETKKYLPPPTLAGAGSPAPFNSSVFNR